MFRLGLVDEAAEDAIHAMNLNQVFTKLLKQQMLIACKNYHELG